MYDQAVKRYIVWHLCGSRNLTYRLSGTILSALHSRVLELATKRSLLQY